MFDLTKIGEKLLKISNTKNASIGDIVFFLKEGNTIGEGTLHDFDDNMAEVFSSDMTTDEKVANAVYQDNDSIILPSDKVFASLEELKGHYYEIFSEKTISKKSDMCSVVPKKKAWTINEESYKENLTNKTIYSKVVAFVTNFLSNFDIPARFEIKFHTVKNASYKEGGYIEKGDVNLGLELRTISGVKIKAELVVPVRNNQLIEPSIIFVNGCTRIIAQSVFDDIVATNTFTHQLYKGPERFVNREMLRLYQDSKVVTVNPGVFGQE